MTQSNPNLWELSVEKIVCKNAPIMDYIQPIEVTFFVATYNSEGPQNCIFFW